MILESPDYFFRVRKIGSLRQTRLLLGEINAFLSAAKDKTECIHCDAERYFGCGCGYSARARAIKNGVNSVMGMGPGLRERVAATPESKTGGLVIGALVSQTSHA